jgi:hypothetical protein
MSGMTSNSSHAKEMAHESVVRTVTRLPLAETAPKVYFSSLRFAIATHFTTLRAIVHG